MLVHCHSGKDRTGIVESYLLDIGVSPERPDRLRARLLDQVD